MTHDTESERAKFEAWLDAHPDKPNKTRDGDGYRYTLADTYWESWSAAIASRPSPVAQDGDWVMVPRESTIAMDRDGCDMLRDLGVNANERDAELCWSAMLAAAPLSAPKADEEKGWRPIESAPKDGTAFFACLESSDIPHAMRFHEDGHLALTWDGFVIADHDWPTHWMSIPPAPTGARHD